MKPSQAIYALEQAIRACKNIEIIDEEIEKIKSGTQDAYFDCHIQDAIYLCTNKRTLLNRAERLMKWHADIANAPVGRIGKPYRKDLIDYLREILAIQHSLRYLECIKIRFDEDNYLMPDGFASDNQQYIFSADTKQEMLDRCNECIEKLQAEIDLIIEGLK